MRIRGSAWHHALHGVPKGDYSIRYWRKRQASRVARRVGKALIREQM